ncbi:hypothetical protein OKW43_001601 [Paraburkholderia sp. WC7.3g]|uniref:hypothetical protein n=1 Tax=Paraburkholderia sp. WC7.3g TaxID=2991070 RepID=UPI003D20B5B4
MKHALAVLLLSLPALCLAEPGSYPPCGDEFPAYVAQMALRKTDILSLDFDATKTRAVRLAFEKIGKYEDGEPMWRGVYQITFEERNGNKIKVVACERRVVEPLPRSASVITHLARAACTSGSGLSVGFDAIVARAGNRSDTASGAKARCGPHVTIALPDFARVWYGLLRGAEVSGCLPHGRIRAGGWALHAPPTRN